jgi:hypothetical protein
MNLEREDYGAMRAWVLRVLALPWRERVALMTSRPEAAPASEAWRTVEALADPGQTDQSAPARLPERMGEWAGLYLTAEGRRRLSGVLRQRRHKRRVGVVSLALPADLHAALVQTAQARGETVAELLRVVVAKARSEAKAKE